MGAGMLTKADDPAHEQRVSYSLRDVTRAQALEAGGPLLAGRILTCCLRSVLSFALAAPPSSTEPRHVLSRHRHRGAAIPLHRPGLDPAE